MKGANFMSQIFAIVVLIAGLLVLSHPRQTAKQEVKSFRRK